MWQMLSQGNACWHPFIHTTNKRNNRNLTALFERLPGRARDWHNRE